MDDGEDGGEVEAALPKKPKKNPTVAFVPELAKEEPPAARGTRSHPPLQP